MNLYTVRDERVPPRTDSESEQCAMWHFPITRTPFKISCVTSKEKLVSWTLKGELAYHLRYSLTQG